MVQRLLLVAFASGAFVFGSTSSCQVSNTNSVAIAGSQIGGVPIARTGTAAVPQTDLGFLNIAPSPGCSTVDLTFSAFTSVHPGLNPDNSNTYISTGANQSLAAGPVTAIFSTVRGNDNVATDTDPHDRINNWVVATAGASTTVELDYQVVSTSVMMQYFSVNLRGVQVGFSGSGSSLTGSIILCLGAVFSPTCGGTTQTINIIAGTTFYNVALALPATTIGVQNNFVLVASNGASVTNRATFITSLEQTFMETPEPATFGLMAAALLALACLRARSRT